MLKPYYQDKWVTIYHGDCREVLPQLDVKVDLVLTDPPYPKLPNKGGWYRDMLKGVAKQYTHSRHIGIPWNTSLDWVDLLPSDSAMVFCSHHSVDLLPIAFNGWRKVALLTWHRPNATPAPNNVPKFDTDFIWCFARSVGIKWGRLQTTLLQFNKLQAGCMATERILNQDGTTAHPTQKPSALIMELLKVGGDLILDPFLGSGTTCYCAKKLNRYSIGIEIEEKYCEIAARRCSQGVMELRI